MENIMESDDQHQLFLFRVLLTVFVIVSQGLNELSEAQHWPVQFVDGYIGSVRVDVPWMNILSDNSRVHISGLMLTVQPKTWAEEASLFESMYSSMMSSKQMAEEIFRTSEPVTEPDVSATVR